MQISGRVEFVISAFVYVDVSRAVMMQTVSMATHILLGPQDKETISLSKICPLGQTRSFRLVGVE